MTIVTAGYADFQRGNQAYKSKEYKKAAELYNSAIEHYKNVEQNDNTKASIEKAHINLSLAWNQYGIELIKNNSLSDGIGKAIVAFQNAVADEANPKHFAAHYNLGLAYERNKKFDDAISAFKKALNLLPNSSVAKGKETDDAINIHCKIIECTQQLQNPSDSHAALKEAYTYVSTVSEAQLSSSSNKEKTTFILEQYAKSCISVNTQDSKEIDKIENLYKTVTGTPLWQVLSNDIYAQYTEKKSDEVIKNLLKQCGLLAQNDKDDGVLKGMKETAGFLAAQLSDHVKLIQDITEADSESALAQVLGATESPTAV